MTRFPATWDPGDAYGPRSAVVSIVGLDLVVETATAPPRPIAIAGWTRARRGKAWIFSSGAGILALPDDALVEELGRLGYIRTSSAMPWLLLTATLVVLAAALWSAWRLAVPAASEAIAARIPPAVEARIGDAARAALVDSSAMLRAPVIDTLRARLGRRFEPMVGMPIDVVVLGGRTVNAFALPGGTIILHQGLLRHLPSQHALAALVAHEAAHVHFRHGMQALVRQVLVASALQALVGDVGGLGGLLAENAGRLAEASYSRSQEKLSDLEGIAFLRRARLDPRGMSELMETLAREATDLPASLEILSSHPLTAERLDYVRAATAPRAEAVAPLLEAAEWEELRAILQQPDASRGSGGG